MEVALSVQDGAMATRQPLLDRIRLVLDGPLKATAEPAHERLDALLCVRMSGVSRLDPERAEHLFGRRHQSVESAIDHEGLCEGPLLPMFSGDPERVRPSE